MAEAMVIGALIFAIGAMFGRMMPGRKRGPKPIEAVCGCSHHYSLHDPKTGECHGSTRVASVPVRDQNGEPVRDSWGEVVFASERGRCNCRRYAGPEPLPQFIAPELSTDG